MTDFANELNTQQLAPVTADEGQILVLAGAGSGKTRVLTYRIAYLIEKCNVSPYEILAITFTNKAAKEMNERIGAMTGRSDIWVSTFHSFCARVLRIDGDKIGYDKGFSIYDESDADRVIKKIFADLNREDNAEMRGKIKSHISKAKTLAMTYKEYALYAKDVREIDDICEIYRRYEAELERSNAMDFDDLLLKTCKLFIVSKETLAKYQKRFRHVLIDEFQDTNKIQYLLVQMIGAYHGNIFAVGDDDQSIYSWRGAMPQNMRDFKNDYPASKLFKLEKNYRSTTQILTAANNIIRNNKVRIGHELTAEKGNGLGVQIKNCYNDHSEAEYVVDEIFNLMHRNGYAYRDFAILVRLNSLTRLVEEKLTLYNMPYQIYGGFKFYERKEIRDLIAYLRIIANPRDNGSLLRIINFPKRGIGDGAVRKLTEIADMKGVSVLEVVEGCDTCEELSSSLVAKLLPFRDIVRNLTIAQGELPLDEFVRQVVVDSGLKAEFQKPDDPENESRWANVEAFVGSAVDYVKDNPSGTLSDFLEGISLLSDVDNAEEGDCVTLSTVHSVKGLEYRVVFIIGLEENVFPSSKAINDPFQMEEERRVMYVAVTRAQERLYLTSAGQRYRFNRTENNALSRFVRETGLLKTEADKNARVNTYHEGVDYNKYKNKTVRSSAYGGGSEYVKNFAEQKVELKKPVENVQGKDLSGFVAGAKVQHVKFGEGTIISVEGEGRDKMANIAFPGLGIKKFSLLVTPITLKK